MKTFQLDGKPDILYFTNNSKEDEELLFNWVYKILEANPSVQIGEKKVGPSEDYYECKIEMLFFILFYDIDYGASIQSKDNSAIEKLKKIFC